VWWYLRVLSTRVLCSHLGSLSSVFSTASQSHSRSTWHVQVFKSNFLGLINFPYRYPTNNSSRCILEHLTCRRAEKQVALFFPVFCCFHSFAFLIINYPAFLLPSFLFLVSLSTFCNDHTSCLCKVNCFCLPPQCLCDIISLVILFPFAVSYVSKINFFSFKLSCLWSVPSISRFS
jgi:hypothetical protein